MKRPLFIHPVCRKLLAYKPGKSDATISSGHTRHYFPSGVFTFPVVDKALVANLKVNSQK